MDPEKVTNKSDFGVHFGGQDGAKNGPRGIPREAKIGTNTKRAPRAPTRAPRGPQESQNGAKSAPREPQESPKEGPGTERPDVI